jgi:hypothetical protein
MNSPVSRRPNPGIGDKDVMLSFDDREPETINAVSEIFRDDIGPDDSSVSLYFPKSDTVTDERANELLWNALKSI